LPHRSKTDALSAAIALCAIAATFGFGSANAQSLEATTDSAPALKKWEPYVELEAKPGTDRTLGTADLFVPLAQDSDRLLFWLFRGAVTDENSEEGNFGLAYRELTNQTGAVPFIWGLYGFYDVQNSQSNNTYDQLTLGAELLTTNMELRGNWYWNPDESTVIGQGITSQSFGPVRLDGINVVQNFSQTSSTITEFTLPGFDVEAGLRLPLDIGDGLWLYGAYFDFQRNSVDISGPRGRVELPFDEVFGLENVDLTLGAEVTRDDVRDTQGYGYARLRVRFGGSDYVPYASLSPIERRMTARIRRDDDIVTADSATTTDINTEIDVTDAPTGESLQVFHVANSAQGAANCTSPGNACTVSTAQGNTNYGAGDVLVPVSIAGTIAANIPLNAARQQIVGGGNTGSANVVLSNTAHSVLALNGLGSRATVQGQVTLFQDVTVKGFDINNPGGTGMFANSFLGSSTAQVSDVAITGGTGVQFGGSASGRAVFASDVSITDTTSTSFDVLGGTTQVVFDGTITQSNAASAVAINNMTDGGVSFGGAIDADTSTAAAIALANNTGAAFAFTGGLALDTTSGAGFSAQGGGTVSVTGAANTIATTTAVALNLDGVGIANDGVTFRSVSASSPGTFGIRVNNTSGIGGISVTGDGSTAASGGTIQSAGTAGVQLIDTRNISLAFMDILQPSTDGIRASNIENFNFVSNRVVNAGSAGISVANGTGTGVVSNNTVSAVLSAFNNGIEVGYSGDGDLTIDTNTVNSLLTIGENGIHVEMGAGDVTTRIRSNTITSIANGFGDGIHYISNSTGTMTTVISSNTIRNVLGAFDDGIDVAYNAGSATTTIQSNRFFSDELISVIGDGIDMKLNTTGATTTTISSNVVAETGGLFDDGVKITVSRGTDHTITATGNLIGQLGGSFDDGIELTLPGGSATNVTAFITSNVLANSSGVGARGLEVTANAPSTLCTQIASNLTDSSLDLISGVGATIDVVNLPTLSAINFGATTNLLGLGTIQNTASCTP
jgi:Inverse autotransporter, beta-domain/Right handed beta helix region